MNHREILLTLFFAFTWGSVEAKIAFISIQDGLHGVGGD